MMDLIEREAALACFHDWIDHRGDVHTPDEMAEYRAIEALPAALAWIPVDEDLPDTDRYVLCTTVNKKGVRTVVRGYYTGESWAVGMNPNVIAWMELPEAYEEGEA